MRAARRRPSDEPCGVASAEVNEGADHRIGVDVTCAAERAGVVADPVVVEVLRADQIAVGQAPFDEDVPADVAPGRAAAPTESNAATITSEEAVARMPSCVDYIIALPKGEGML